VIYTRRLKKCAGAFQHDRVVVPRRGKPAAVLVVVEGSDWKVVMSIASSPSAMEHDLRIDFFRGLALFCIFVVHLPNNILREFTPQSLIFADTAEVSILISGYTAGMVYGAAMERQGFSDSRGPRLPAGMAALCCARFLFMMFIAMVAYTADVLNSSLYAEEFGAPNFLNEPGLAAMKAPTLQFQPAFMDIPPLVQHFSCSSFFWFATPPP
jgi:hypothetical protein